MQNYIDAFVAHNTADYQKAEQDCKAARAKLKEVGDPDTSVALAAKILGTKAADLKALRNKYSETTFALEKWPGVSINIRNTDAYKAAEKAVENLRADINACCERERDAKGRNHESSLLRFRRFMRARFGPKPTCTTRQAIAAYMETIKPVACSLK